MGENIFLIYNKTRLFIKVCIEKPFSVKKYESIKPCGVDKFVEGQQKKKKKNVDPINRSKYPYMVQSDNVICVETLARWILIEDPKQMIISRN